MSSGYGTTTHSSNSSVFVTERSWCARVQGAIKGVFFGFLVLCGGIYVLHWNEGRSIQRYQALQEGEQICIDVIPNDIRNENDNKLVHFTGDALPQQPSPFGSNQSSSAVTDNVFGVSPNAETTIKLRRSVQMYQWTEQSDARSTTNKGGSTTTETTYSYRQSFEDHWVDSTSFDDSFGHENPTSWPYDTTTFVAASVSVGAYKIATEMIAKMNWYQTLPVTKDTIYEEAIKKRAVNFQGGLYIGSIVSEHSPTAQGVTEPGNPHTGDLRVMFDAVYQSDVSMVVQQRSGHTIGPYSTSNGNDIFLLMRGTHTAKELFVQAERENVLLTWAVRFLGTLIIYLGCRAILAPAAVVADVVPCLGDLVEMGAGIVSSILAGSISALVIALSWILYRPILGGFILIVVAPVVYYGTKKCRICAHPTSNTDEMSKMEIGQEMGRR